MNKRTLSNFFTMLIFILLTFSTTKVNAESTIIYNKTTPNIVKLDIDEKSFLEKKEYEYNLSQEGT